MTKGQHLTPEPDKLRVARARQAPSQTSLRPTFVTLRWDDADCVVAAIRCQLCGAANAPTSRFCESCGAELLSPRADTLPAAAAVGPPPHLQTTTESPRVRRGTAITILIGIGACIAGICIGIVLRQSPALDAVLGTRIDVEHAEQAANARAGESFRDGRAQGDAAGYERGYDAGRHEGSSIGDAQGYQRGFDDGYAAGADDAYTGAGTTIQRVAWSDNIGDDSESGICIFFKGSYLVDSWRWVFRGDGGSKEITDDDFSRSSTDWCYDTSFLESEVPAFRSYDSLTVYVTRDGKIDRWGPKAVPKG